MPIDPASDLSTILGHLGVTGVSFAATVGANTLNGFLTEAYTESNGVEVLQKAFMTTSAAADTAGVTNGTSITIDSVVYTVREVKPSSFGMSTLILEDT